MPMALAALLLSQALIVGGESTYEPLKPKLFTIEVHSGNQGAKSALGSGYLVTADGLVATNYHVVGTYIEEPERYSIRVRGTAGELPARLVGFDLVNDLALLEVDGVEGDPLSLATSPPPPGAPIVAFGNPQGLGLSRIEGIFNGFAEKGFVDRMLLSMPLNAGMSGGPILNERDEVIGTNVSIMWLSNSLSFGVPVDKLRALLAGPRVETTRKALLEETRRQLRDLESQTAARLAEGFREARDEPPVAVGGARSRRPPDVFECWDGSEVHETEQVTESWHQCNLQFTPMVEDLGPAGSVEILVRDSRTEGSAYGFYGALDEQAVGWSQVEATAPGDKLRSPPRCVAGRLRTSGRVWKASTCVNAWVMHPGLAEFELLAVSVSSARESVLASLRMSGFRYESFESLARQFLEGIGPGEEP